MEKLDGCLCMPAVYGGKKPPRHWRSSSRALRRRSDANARNGNASAHPRRTRRGQQSSIQPRRPVLRGKSHNAGVPGIARSVASVSTGYAGSHCEVTLTFLGTHLARDTMMSAWSSRRVTDTIRWIDSCRLYAEGPARAKRAKIHTATPILRPHLTIMLLYSAVDFTAANEHTT